MDVVMLECRLLLLRSWDLQVIHLNIFHHLFLDMKALPTSELKVPDREKTGWNRRTIWARSPMKFSDIHFYSYENLDPFLHSSSRILYFSNGNLRKSEFSSFTFIPTLLPCQIYTMQSPELSSSLPWRLADILKVHSYQWDTSLSLF